MYAATNMEMLLKIFIMLKYLTYAGATYEFAVRDCWDQWVSVLGVYLG